MDKAAKAFFSSPRFAVAGASSDSRKFGNKIFAWYLTHDLPVTPLNPGNANITVNGKAYPTAATVSHLDNPADTGLSIVTPPKVTAELLREAKRVGINAVWLQPGTFDDDVLAYAKENFPGKAVGGMEDGARHEGWCVLIDGDNAMTGTERGGKL